MTDTTDVRTVLVTDADVTLLDTAIAILRASSLMTDRVRELVCLRERVRGQKPHGMMRPRATRAGS